MFLLKEWSAMFINKTLSRLVVFASVTMLFTINTVTDLGLPLTEFSITVFPDGTGLPAGLF